MPSQLAAVSSLLLGSAFLLMAGGLQGLLLPIAGAVAGFKTIELGLLGTSWAAGFIAGCLMVPAMVRRVGHIRSYGVLASLCGITILLNLLIMTPPAWIGLRALSGFGFAGAAMIVESWLNERATSANRGTIFSIYQAVNFGASTAGQVLLATGLPIDHSAFAVGAILYCLAILPTALTTAATPRPLKTTGLNIRRLYANSPISAVGCFLIGMANGAFGTLGAVYAQKIGLPITAVATLMAGALLGGALVQYPLGRLSDRTDRRRVLVAVGVGACLLGLALATIQPRDPLVVTGLVIVFGAMIYPMYALVVAHANDFAAGDDFINIAGGLLLLYGLGTMAGPIAAAPAMDWIAPEGLFAFTALIHLLMVAYAVLRMSRRPRPADAPHEAFHSLPPPKTVTPESAVLDPRAEPGVRDDAKAFQRPPSDLPAD